MKVNNKGVTLVELMIVISLIGIVVVLAFSFNILGSKMLRNGEKQYQLQYNLRMAGEFITKDLRNATEIEIINSSIDSFDTGFHYLYIKNNSIQYYYNGVERSLTEQVLTNTSDIFSIIKLENDKNLISFKLEAETGGQGYSIQSEVLLNNIIRIEPNINNAIRYKK